MNREQKRLLQRQGQLGADGEPAPRKREGTRPSPAAAAAQRTRVKPREFLHEVNVELRKVAWPTRAETINYSTVVLITLVIVISLIFVLDYGFSAAARFLFK
ncbi:MAG TPA: preprotein translocase subunit SecE [Acidimicrobiales bacterium]|jgi:preprotein translocase SecE subunit|nr:preprotein translocase subunit SecE [Acidimicrobiales bacterium]